MSATNKTANYELPQFVGTDIPSWLGDVNGAMAKIDTAIKSVADNSAEASQDVAEMDGRLTQVETQASNTASAVNQLTNTVSGNDTKHTNAEGVLQGGITANTQAIATANQNITALDTRVGTVEEEVGNVSGQLLAGEQPFYFDVQDGVYGYNTSEERGADTFHPFSAGEKNWTLTLYLDCIVAGQSRTYPYSGTLTLTIRHQDGNTTVSPTSYNTSGEGLITITDIIRVQITNIRVGSLVYDE